MWEHHPVILVKQDALCPFEDEALSVEPIEGPKGGEQRIKLHLDHEVHEILVSAVEASIGSCV